MSKRAHLAHDWFPDPLPSNVQIGERSWCYSSYAFLHYRSRRRFGLRVGHDSGIYNGTFFELGPQGQVEIGDFCTLVGVIISTNGRVRIGDYTLLSHEVVLADSYAAAPPTARPASKRVSGEIWVGENAWVGARATLLSGASIGDGAIVGAAAVVDFEVPPFAIAAGNPARIVGFSKPAVENVSRKRGGQFLSRIAT